VDAQRRSRGLMWQQAARPRIFNPKNLQSEINLNS
jgi:hypothetical protein